MQAVLYGHRINSGLARRNLGRNAEALAVYERVLEVFGMADGLADDRVICALVFKGRTLRSLARCEEAIAAFQAAENLAARMKELDSYTKVQIDASKVDREFCEKLLNESEINAARSQQCPPGHPPKVADVPSTSDETAPKIDQAGAGADKLPQMGDTSQQSGDLS